MINWYDGVPTPKDANGLVVPLDTKELVYRGETRGVCGFSYSTWNSRWRVVFMDMNATDLSACTMPDSWERLEEDARKAPREYIEGRKIAAEKDGRVATMTSDILRRAKALCGLREGKKDMPKAMIGQPMAGETDEQIAATRERAKAKLEAMGYEVVNTQFTDEWYSDEAMKERGVVQVPLCFLAKSLENMSLCHAAYFCKGWENARGCRIELDVAVAYGLEVLYED